MHIETIIEDLSHAKRLPRKAIQASLSAPDQVVARTVDIIDRCVRCDHLDDGTVSEDEQSALVILLHILGELGEPRLFEPLLRLLACDAERVEDLIGDSLTESVHKILISTYDGDPQPLLALMSNREADDFSRDAAFRAWTYLAADEVWPKEISRSYLEWAFEELEPRKDSNIWASWLHAVAILGFEELVPMVDEVFAEPRFCVDIVFGQPIVPLDREDFAADLRRSLEATDEDGWLDEQGLHPVEDTVTELSRWHCFSEKYHREQKRERISAVNVDTVINDYRNVGRNDPCPCGSGKKFKKCCLR